MKKLISFAILFMMFSGYFARGQMVLVKQGSFEMGDIFGDGEEDELPLHMVELSSFYAGKCEITIGEFRQFVESTGYVSTAEKEKKARIWKAGIGVVNDSTCFWDKLNYEVTDQHPVVLVSWIDAVEYCNWRSRIEGLEACYAFFNDSVTCDFTKKGYRLLTEAEWEYIARDGGKRQKYSWGNGEPFVDEGKACNLRDETLGRASSKKGIWEGYNDDFVYAAPVGSFEPNSLGIYDLSGNVYEWCWDWYDENYYENSPSKDPNGPVSGEFHACRGGSFICYRQSIRVINRGKGNPDLTFSWGGFRIARTK